MTEIVVQGKRRNRTYIRRFDHDEARRLRGFGSTYKAIASEFGVSPAAVYFAVNPEAREVANAQAMRRYHEKKARA